MVEFCIHLANVLYLVSFLSRDMLWLRVLTCAGLVLGLVFFACQPAPMYGPSVWHVVFLGINGYQIRRLILDRRKVTLTPEQMQAAEELFGHLPREDLLTLLTRAMCENPNRLRNYHKASRLELDDDQRVVRDIAFSRLSRGEILNLLTRRVWNSVVQVSHLRWKRRTRVEVQVPEPGPVVLRPEAAK